MHRGGSGKKEPKSGGGGTRWSLRCLLMDSPLPGRRLRAQRVFEGSTSLNSQKEAQTTSPTTEGECLGCHGSTSEECPLCLCLCGPELMTLVACGHRACNSCLHQYITVEICEGRAPVACPACPEHIDPDDVRIVVGRGKLLDKYEDFCVRRALAADPDTRWCPAPDCRYAVIAQGCASCPRLQCQAPGCGKAFCYHCKAAWHPTQTCSAASGSSNSRTSRPPDVCGELKACPRCSVLIAKVEDGSCNHMACCVCGAEFCWLCMREVTDLHYLSPSGCTFWGRRPWSRRKKLLWQLGTLAGAPFGIALAAGAALPALLLGLPLWAGRRAARRLRRASPRARRAAIAAAATAALLISPLVAGLAVGIGVPILLFYVYGVVPVSLCRAGGATTPPSSPPPAPAEPIPTQTSMFTPPPTPVLDDTIKTGSTESLSLPTVLETTVDIEQHNVSKVGDEVRITVSGEIDTPSITIGATASRTAVLKSIFLHGRDSPISDPEAPIKSACPENRHHLATLSVINEVE